MSNCLTLQRVVDSHLLEYANKNRDEGYFNDLMIIARNENISANRLVLSCYSKYFERMFKLSVLSKYSIIEIQAVDGTTIKALINLNL